MFLIDDDMIVEVFRLHHQQDIATIVSAEWHAFIDRFATDEDIYDFFFQLKWPHGFVCPRCNGDHATTIRTRRMPLYQCRSCYHQTTLTVNTIMEGTRTPLHKWLTAFFFAPRSDVHLNARKLQTLISVTYKTAWSMLRQIQEMISSVDEEYLLEGNVHATSTFSGYRYGILSNLAQKQPFFIAGELDEERVPVYIKVKIAPTEYIEGYYLNREVAVWFQQEHVSAGTRMGYLRFSPPSRALLQVFHNFRYKLIQTHKKLYSHVLQPFFDECCYYYNQKAMGKNEIQICEELARLSMSSSRYRPIVRASYPNPWAA